MKVSKQLSFFLLALIGILNLNAQNDKIEVSDSTSSKTTVSFALSTGVFNYRGDVGQSKNNGTTENFEIGYSAGIEYTQY